MPKLQLTTKTVIDRIPLATDGQQLYWCTDLRGFGLLVGKRGKTFVVEASINGNSRRATVGRYGDLTLNQARTRAIALLGDMRGRKRDITEERRQATASGMTLSQAWELYESYLKTKGRSPNTIAQYQGSLRRWMGDWLNKPLVEITRDAARRKHLQLTKENGPFAANLAMKVLQAIWHRARRQHPALPEAPTANVDHNAEPPRTLIVNGQKVAPVIPFDSLSSWYGAVMQTESPIRRDLFLWLLFTGTRSEEARSMKWSQVDLENGTVIFPVTKTKPFALPLSDFLVQLLERRRSCNVTQAHFPNSECVFPARTHTGYMPGPQLHGEELKRYDIRWSPHILRHSYITIAENKCAIPNGHCRLLVNHAAFKSRDVHSVYVHPELGDLRRSQKAITDALKLACGIDG